MTSYLVSGFQGTQPFSNILRSENDVICNDLIIGFIEELRHLYRTREISIFNIQRLEATR